MSCCELCGEESSAFANYFPQFIGVIGTLLGTFLGWFLKFLQDNMGKTEVIIEHFENFRDSSNSYAFYLSLFICNHSVQRTYIKDLELVFYNNCKEIKKTALKIECGNMNYLEIPKKELIKIIKLDNNAPQSILLCNIINLNEIENVNRIFLRYEKGKRKKRILLKKNFSITNVKKYSKREIF